MDDLVGYGPVLFTREKILRDRAENIATIDAQHEPSVKPFLDRLGVNAVLLRPDRYILATAKSEKEVAALASVKLPSPAAPENSPNFQ
ncbi:hypothetical protein [Roseibium sp. SCP14]|uniref:hypothetical protein n=1 Tax=Roseibium sp. SCP14 TaxID=3141375 RepID=UPI00333C1CF1